MLKAIPFSHVIRGGQLTHTSSHLAEVFVHILAARQQNLEMLEADRARDSPVRRLLLQILARLFGALVPVAWWHAGRSVLATSLECAAAIDSLVDDSKQ